MRFWRIAAVRIWLWVLTTVSNAAFAQIPDSLNAGFLFDSFDLTLAPGKRTEAVGPLFYSQTKESEHQWAVPPLFSKTYDPELDWEELDFAYPLLTYDRFGPEYRFQFLQWLSWSGGVDTATETNTHRFNLFPVYFHQWSEDPERDYWALFPIYGKLRNRFFRDEIDFVLWPVYVKTQRRTGGGQAGDDPFTALGYQFARSRKGGVVTYNYLAPLFHLRFGDGMRGWQAWPLAGYEHKRLTVSTNEWGDEIISPGYEHRFLVWPLYFDRKLETGSTNEGRFQAFLPFYSSLRSPLRDSTTYLWPLGLTITDDRERKYHEVGAPWPLIVFTHGEGKQVKRVFPFFSHASATNLQSDFYAWPIYKYNRQQGETLDRERTRILFFLYSDTVEKNKETEKHRRLVQAFPLYSFRRELDGSTRLQVLSILEPFIPQSKSIDRNYSHLWSLWREEKNGATGDSSQSLLWNLYRQDRRKESKKVSLLFGFFQYESSSAGKSARLFYIPLGKRAARPEFGPVPAGTAVK